MRLFGKKLDLDWDFNLDCFWFLGFFAAALFLWLVGLGDLPLRDWDEGYYATVARDMYRTGNWLYPSYLGEPFLLKPPLLIWGMAFSFQLGGIGELTSRLPAAFLTAMGVPFLYLLAKEAFSSQLPAIFTALVYLTLLPVVRHGRLAMLDGIVNSFFILSLWCLLKSRRERRWGIGFGIGLGLIALTKGVLVFALGAIPVIFLLVKRQEKLLGNPYLWVGILLGSLPVFAWYGAQIKHYGKLFLQVHFQSQSFDRLSTAVEGNSGPIWYYLIELLKYTLPWLLFLPGGLRLAWQNRRQSWGSLILIGAVLYLSIISLMGTKLPWYIMPLYPFFSLAVGAYLAQLARGRKYPKILAVSLGLLSVVALGGCLYFIFSEPQITLIGMAILLSATFALTGWKCWHSQSGFIWLLGTGLYISLALLMISPAWIWELKEAFPVQPVGALIQTHTPINSVIYTSFAYSRPSLDFYSNRRVIASDAATLQQLSSQPAYLLLDRAALPQLNLKHSRILGRAGDFILVQSQPEF